VASCQRLGDGLRELIDGDNDRAVLADRRPDRAMARGLVPEETLGHAFEPFFTTKETDHGTGLGLSTAFGIVRQANGQIWVESAAGLGTKASALFPLVGSPPEPVKTSWPSSSTSFRRHGFARLQSRQQR
jgi:hypothetical protein